MISSKPLQGDGPGAKPAPQNLLLKADQLREPDSLDRTESLKADWDEFLDSIRATAGTSQQGAGNHTPIIAVGAQAPYEVVAGRRRYLACKELGLPIDAKVYPFLGDDDRARFRYSENFQRNNYTPYEIVANVQKELAQGRDREWLCSAFGKSLRSIAAYIAIAKDAAMTEEIRRGLSLREASRLQQEFGDDAANEAANLRQAGHSGAQESQSGPNPKRISSKEAPSRGPLVAKVVPGTRVLVRFDEKKAEPKDFHAYSQWLDKERKRIGTMTDAIARRKPSEAQP
jgi:ParB/RepB/Spo0J family partition protein